MEVEQLQLQEQVVPEQLAHVEQPPVLNVDLNIPQEEEHQQIPPEEVEQQQMIPANVVQGNQQGGPGDEFIELNDFLDILMEEEQEALAPEDQGQISYNDSQHSNVSEPLVNIMQDLNAMAENVQVLMGHQILALPAQPANMEHLAVQNQGNLHPEFPNEQELQQLLMPIDPPPPMPQHILPQQLDHGMGENLPANHNEHHNLHVGMMMHQEENLPNPVFTSVYYNASASYPLVNATQSSKPNVDIYRLWARYFSDENAKVKPIEIPGEWLALFTTVLLSSTHFSWAKEFLNSKATNGPASGLKFLISPVCPDKATPKCVIQELNSTGNETEEADQQGLITPPQSKNKGKEVLLSQTVPLPKALANCSGPIVETEVRRSARIITQNNGFKRRSCNHRNCLACSSAPPVLSSKVIKNLGIGFAKMKTSDITDEMLNKKKKGKGPVGNKKKPSDSAQNGKENKKKGSDEDTNKEDKE
ncbi:hypothetical protein QOZ80_4AG0310700 [Eleusine coracana subsp. coracana]|nr:hypothetical protein QOZ80_4AG0310700 [Eleusine coracana subsp. coracana]